MRRRWHWDGGVAIVAAAAAAVVFSTVIVLLGIRPASQLLPSGVTAPLTRLEAPLHPTTTASTTPSPSATLSVTTTPPATVGPGEVFYSDCLAARAAGVTDLRRGGAGYRPGLDRDADGRACESPPVPSTTAAAPPPPKPAAPPPTASTTTTRRSSTGTGTTVRSVPTAPPLVPSVTAPPILTTPLPPPTTLPPTTAAPPTEPPTEPPATEPPATTIPPPRFTDCNQVVEAGVDVPLTPASPWWNPALDVDGDGLACEDDGPVIVPSTTTTLTPPVDCVAAWDLGLAPIFPDSPYWNPVWDPDGRGVACATDPRVVDAVSSTATTTGDGR